MDLTFAFVKLSFSLLNLNSIVYICVAPKLLSHEKSNFSFYTDLFGRDLLQKEKR
jgi:hypothetical protein